MSNRTRASRVAAIVRACSAAFCLILSACGGGSGGGAGYGGMVEATYSINATVSGLTGTGLVLSATATGTASVPVGANGTVTMASGVTANTAYAVTVATQPSSPAQVCAVTNGSGTITNINITNVAVSCAAAVTQAPPPTSYAVNASVAGLAGSGLVLRVFSEVMNVGTGGDSDHSFGNVTVSATGNINLATGLPANAQYLVQIVTQPSSPAQTCGITNATGSITSISTMPVSVSCANNLSVSVTVSGLTAGTTVFQLNGGSSLSVTANGVATFTNGLAPGAAYSVIQVPNSAEFCTVINPAGTMPATALNLNVACGPGYTVGGTVSGLFGATGVTLQLAGNNTRATLTTRANGAFVFNNNFSFVGAANYPFAPDVPYTLTVVAQPTLPTQTCTVANGTGTTLNANVTNVQISCAPQGYAVTGNVFGLAGQGLTLQINGTNNLAVTQNGTGAASFPTPIPTGTAFAVTVATQPSAPAQSCTVSNAQGTISNANITNLQVLCVTPPGANSGTPGPTQNAYFIGTPPNPTTNSAVLGFPTNQGGTLASAGISLTPINASDAYVAVASDAAGNLYVAAVTLTGTVVSNPRVLSFAAGTKGAATPTSTIQLPVGSSPQSIAVDSAGNIYVSGTGATTDFIYEIAAGSSGNATPMRTLTPQESCDVLAVDGTGNIVCVDLGLMEQVLVFGPTQTGSDLPARSFYPGYPYAAGFLQDDPDGNTFGVVKGLALDPAGDIYLAVGIFERGGPDAILKVAGGTTSTDDGTEQALLEDALLNASLGPIQIDTGGNLYVLEPVSTTQNLVWRFGAQSGGGYAVPTVESLSLQLSDLAAFAVH